MQGVGCTWQQTLGECVRAQEVEGVESEVWAACRDRSLAGEGVEVVEEEVGEEEVVGEGSAVESRLDELERLVVGESAKFEEWAR